MTQPINVNPKEPQTAGMNPVISKPGVKAAAIFNAMPFTTSRKSPNVKKVIGSVKMANIGQTKIFTKPMATEAINADPKPVILKPGTKCAVAMIVTLANSQCSRDVVIFLKPHLNCITLQQAPNKAHRCNNASARAASAAEEIPRTSSSVKYTY